MTDARHHRSPEGDRVQPSEPDAEDVPIALADFIAEHTREVSLRDRTRLRIRPIHPGDKAALRAGFEKLSSDARYRRFLSPINHLSDSMLAFLTEIDYHDHFAWVVISPDEPGRPGVGVARYVRDPDYSEIAEPAVAILDSYHGHGLGTLLLDLLIRSAVDHGVSQFRASLLSGNTAMHRLFQEAGARMTYGSSGVLYAQIVLPTRHRARWQLARRLLRGFGAAPMHFDRDIHPDD